MSLLFVLAAALSASGVDVALAPDQPLPLIYVDDPLIVEFRADEPARISATVQLQAPGTESQAWNFGPITLRPDNARWESVEPRPPMRGLYSVAVTIPNGENPWRHDQTIACIDRPLTLANETVVITANEYEPNLGRVLQAGAVGWIELSTASPDFDDEVQSAQNQNLRVAALISPGADGATIQSLAAAHSPDITRWRLAMDIPAEEALNFAKAVRAGAPRAEIAVTIDNPLAMDPFIEFAGSDPSFFWTIELPAEEGPDVEEFRAQTVDAGLERFNWDAVCQPGSDDANAEGPKLLKSLIRASSSHARHMTAEASALIQNEAFQNAFPYLCAHNRRLAGYTFIGTMHGEDGQEAYVFRRGEVWTLVAWAESETNWPIEASDARVIEAYDATGNPLAIPQREEDALVFSLTTEPRYFQGRNGFIIEDAARARARREAEMLLDSEILQEAAPPEMVEVIRQTAAVNTPKPARRDFLLLLQLFPQWEESWFSAELDSADAAALIGGVARMMRGLAILEQESGETFLDPLPDRLARCQEMLAAYVTGLTSDSDANIRGEWLYDEITNLTEEARRLADEGRGIEGDAIAAIAEWRARALRYTGRPPAQEGGEAPPAPESEDNETNEREPE